MLVLGKLILIINYFVYIMLMMEAYLHRGDM